MDSILAGCILAVWNNPALDRRAWRPKNIHVAAALCVLLTTFVVRDELFRETLRYTLQSIALFVLFAYVLWDRGWLAQLLGSAPMRRIAAYSYTFYLSHLFILAMLLEPLRGQDPLWNVAVNLLLGGSLTLAYCAAMYAFVEKPLAGWRRTPPASNASGFAAGT